MTSAIDRLAEFGAVLEPERVDPAIVGKVKEHLLDTIAATCAGVDEPRLNAVRGVILRWGGAAEAMPIGHPIRLPAPKAAFLNALHARIHTFDDTHEAGPAHPGSAVVAAALATAERSAASGRILLASLLAGYEVATRVSAALGAPHYGAGFHTTGSCAPFAAAAAAARIAGLEPATTAAALALAGEGAIGLRQYQLDGSLLDTALNSARGAELGVAAAEFAAAGATGPVGILDGRWGMLRVMAGSDPLPSFDDLGGRWEFDATIVKPFASCRFTHGPIDVLRNAKLNPHDVEAIEIATFRASCDVSDRPDPRTRAEAILSHQVAAALALLGRAIVPSDYDELGDAVRDLAARVRVRNDVSFDLAYPGSWPHRITVQSRGRDPVTLFSERPPAADNAMARTKFHALADPVLGRERAEELAALVARIETVTDLEPLFRLLHPRMARAA